MGDEKNTEELEDESGGPNGGPDNSLEEVHGGVGIHATAGAEASNEVDVDPGILSSAAGGAFPTAVNAEEPLDDVSGGPDTVAPMITDALEDVDGGQSIRFPPVHE